MESQQWRTWVRYLSVIHTGRGMIMWYGYYKDERDLPSHHKFYKSLSEDPLEGEEEVSSSRYCKKLMCICVVCGVNHLPVQLGGRHIVPAFFVQVNWEYIITSKIYSSTAHYYVCMCRHCTVHVCLTACLHHRLSNETGKLEFCLVSEGSIPKSNLDSKDGERGLYVVVA